MIINAGIVTTKIQECREFYTKFLDFAVVHDMEWYVQFVQPGGGFQIAFQSPEPHPDKPAMHPRLSTAFSGSGGWITIAVESIDPWYEKAKQLGIPIETEPETMPWGHTVFSVVCPSGLFVGIVGVGQ